jgi:hypothetical protein
MGMFDRLFASHYGIDIGVPVLAAMLSVYAKCVSRNDQHKPMSRDDFAVGLDLAAAALLILVISWGAEVGRAPSQLSNGHVASCVMSAPWVVLAMALALWALSTLIRKCGWNARGELKVGWGVLAPIVVGAVILLFAVSWRQRCLSNVRLVHVKIAYATCAGSIELADVLPRG